MRLEVVDDLKFPGEPDYLSPLGIIVLLESAP